MTAGMSTSSRHRNEAAMDRAGPGPRSGATPRSRTTVLSVVIAKVATPAKPRLDRIGRSGRGGHEEEGQAEEEVDRDQDQALEPGRLAVHGDRVHRECHAG